MSEECKVAPRKIAQSDGVFHDVSPIRLESVTDGLGNTVFMAEKSTTTLSDLDAVNLGLSAKHGWYITGNWGDTLFTAFYPPNAYKRIAVGVVEAMTNSASSLHPGGVNALMGDGSVRFIKETVSAWPFDPATGQPVGIVYNPRGWWERIPAGGVWQALSTRSGGEVTNGDGY